MTHRYHPVTIAHHEMGQRLDRVLDKRFPEFGRRAIRALFDEGRVICDGQRCRRGDRAESEQQLVVQISTEPLPIAEPALSLTVRFERPTLVVVSKPTGQPTAPLTPEGVGTLVGALLARYPEMRGIGIKPREPGLIHRLDTHTSGLVLAARTAMSFTILHAALQAGQLTKSYLACVIRGSAIPDSGVIQFPLGPEPHSGRVRVYQTIECITGYHRPCTTQFQVLERIGDIALVKAQVGRAFRHQIRAHLAAIGHPLVGDTLYGAPPEPKLGPGFALHASQIAWAGNSVVEGFDVVESLPPRLMALLE